MPSGAGLPTLGRCVSWELVSPRSSPRPLLQPAGQVPSQAREWQEAYPGVTQWGGQLGRRGSASLCRKQEPVMDREASPTEGSCPVHSCPFLLVPGGGELSSRFIFCVWFWCQCWGASQALVHARRALCQPWACPASPVPGSGIPSPSYPRFIHSKTEGRGEIPWEKEAQLQMAVVGRWARGSEASTVHLQKGGE